MTRPVSPIEFDYTLDIAKRRAKAHGITLIWDNDAATASTDGRRVVLPPIKQPITQDMLDKLYSFIIHECGHLNRREVFSILEDNEPPQYLASLYNIIEDNAMERETASQWPGDHKALSVGNDIIVSEMDHNIRPTFETPEIPWDEADNNPLVAFMLQLYARCEWDDRHKVTLECLHRDLPDPVKDQLDEYLAEGWHTKMDECTDEHSTWKCAKELAVRMYPDREDDIKNMEAEAGKSSGKPSRGESDEDAEAAPLDQGYNVNWADVVTSEHKSEEEKQIGTGVGIEWTDYTGIHKPELMPINEIGVTDLATWSPGYTLGRVSHYMSEDENARHLTNQVRRYIQSIRRVHINRHRDLGRLDKASLVKLALPPIDGGKYNKKIFYDHTQRTIKDVAVSVLVDWSGSMGGTKAEMAADAAGRLVEVLGTQIGAPVEVLAFSVSATSCDMGIVKSFADRQVTRRDIADRFVKFLGKMGGNNDADAVNFAYQRLLKRKESRKVLIVLSDGAPTDTWSFASNAHTNLKYITEYIQSNKRDNVELWGVGLEDTTVRHYYKLHVIIKRAEEINEKLMTIIKHGYENYRRAA